MKYILFIINHQGKNTSCYNFLSLATHLCKLRVFGLQLLCYPQEEQKVGRTENLWLAKMFNITANMSSSFFFYNIISFIHVYTKLRVQFWVYTTCILYVVSYILSLCHVSYAATIFYKVLEILASCMFPSDVKEESFIHILSEEKFSWCSLKFYRIIHQDNDINNTSFPSTNFQSRVFSRQIIDYWYFQ